jgi:hypothetical protein
MLIFPPQMFLAPVFSGYTADLTSGETVSGSAEGGSYANCIDDNGGTATASLSAVIANTSYIRIQFATAKDIRQITCHWRVTGYAWKGMDLEYSDNGSSWSVAASVSPANNTSVQTFNGWPSAGDHLYWQFKATDTCYNPASGIDVIEIEMMEWL